MLKLLIFGLSFVGAFVLLTHYTDLRGTPLLLLSLGAGLLTFSID